PAPRLRSPDGPLTPAPACSDGPPGPTTSVTGPGAGADRAGTGSDEVGVRAHLGDLGLIGHDRGSPGRVEMHHPQVGDAFALATRDPSSFVRIRGVRQILVLAELLGDGGLEVFGAQTALTGLEKRFDRGLLRPVDDVVDHRPGSEVGEVE